MSNFGGRGLFLYTSDNGKDYQMSMRLVDATATGQASIPPDTSPDLPRNFVPRHVWFKGSDGGRRKVNMGDSGNAFYTTGGSFSADGVTYTASGRVGEKQRGGVRD
jgi:hypothetical protein